jgi:nicotinate-nucleotide pyrophosphorylase (carboxylating)
MSYNITKDNVLPLIRLAISEDISTGDVTSEAIFTGTEKSSAYIMAKQSGIVCGGNLVSWVYEEIDPSVVVKQSLPEGSRIDKGQTIITIEGPTKSILEGERIALNFFQRMSGIATKTDSIVKITDGTAISILDTRKTLPGFRLIDKYSVKCGGGKNHRIGLYDMVLIKDNHIKAAGSITAAVNKVRAKWGNQFTIEVETTTLDEVKEAVNEKADIIMLDNMDVATMRTAIEIISGRAKIEISGNMDEEKIGGVRELKIDYISIGALTHSVDAFDWSMKFNY